MSTSENISLWKKKAEIDYIPLFVSLWFSLNAWMRDRFIASTDRELLNLLKEGRHSVADQFFGLIGAESNDARGNSFKGNLAELHRALVNANIPYSLRNHQDKTVSLDCCIIDWNNGQPVFETVLKGVSDTGKLTIDNNLWIEDDQERLFAAYMEIVYQIRCALFHGDLAPIPANERVIRHLYITLSMIMERV